MLYIMEHVWVEWKLKYQECDAGVVLSCIHRFKRCFFCFSIHFLLRCYIFKEQRSQSFPWEMKLVPDHCAGNTTAALVVVFRPEGGSFCPRSDQSWLLLLLLCPWATQLYLSTVWGVKGVRLVCTLRKTRQEMHGCFILPNQVIIKTMFSTNTRVFVLGNSHTTVCFTSFTQRTSLFYPFPYSVVFGSLLSLKAYSYFIRHQNFVLIPKAMVS